MEYEQPDEQQDNILDTNWITEFELNDKDYIKFYNEDVYDIKICSIYVDGENNIENIKEECLLLKQQNIISREEIIHVIKKNSFKDKKRYTILSLLKYNVDIEAPNIKHYLKNNKDFLVPVKNIDTIPLKKTISMFQNLNTIFIVFYEKPTSTNNQTKKVYITNHTKTKKKQLKV